MKMVQQLAEMCSFGNFLRFRGMFLATVQSILKERTSKGQGHLNVKVICRSLPGEVNVTISQVRVIFFRIPGVGPSPSMEEVSSVNYPLPTLGQFLRRAAMGVSRQVFLPKFTKKRQILSNSSIFDAHC